MAQRKPGSISLVGALTFVLSITSVSAQTAPLTLVQLPLEIQQHIGEVQNSCRELDPEIKFYDPLRGVTIIDLEGDGSTDFLVDNESICLEHMPGANCTNRGCDLLIWQQRNGKWRKVFEEHLYAKFISIDDTSRRLQLMALTIYGGDPRCHPNKNREYFSGDTCDILVHHRNGQFQWQPVKHYFPDLGRTP